MGVSRQVKAEAEHVFYNDNLFVLIKLHFTSGVYSRMKPFILAENEVARSFKHYTVTLELNVSDFLISLPHYRQVNPPCSFMIAGEDLPWLVRTLGIINGISEYHEVHFLQQSFFSISAVGPFEGADTSSDGRSCLDYQKLSKLLEPLCHLRGIQWARLDGHMSAEYKHRILESIKKPWLDVEASIGMASISMGTGDEAFRYGRHLQAIYAYQEALDYLTPFYDMSPWHLRCKALSSETLSKLFCHLFNQQRAARIRLEIGRQASDLARSAQSGEDVLDESVRAGVDYAIAHFSDSRGFWVADTQYKPTHLSLAAQLDIIEGYDSDPRMKKALLRALVAIMKNHNDKASYMKQWKFGCWDHWFLEI